MLSQTAQVLNSIRHQSLLDIVKAHLREAVIPKANQLDHDRDCLRSTLSDLGQLQVTVEATQGHLLALKVPKSWGGLGLDDLTYRFVQLEIARYSGALAFLQTQHHSATAMLVKSPNLALQERYFPAIAQQGLRLGVGFSHLRRRGDPVVRATPVAGGYAITGQVPWVTGLGCFQECIVGATLPDRQELYGVLPFQEARQPSGGYLVLSEPMALSAFAATNTVSAQLHNWFLPAEQIVAINPAGSIHEKDQRSPLLNSFLALGCAQAGLDIVQAAYHKHQLAFVDETYQQLQQKWDTCKSTIVDVIASHGASPQEQLHWRTQAIQLAFTCSQAAIVASSGAANLMSHSAQRVYREALVYAVSGQSTALMATTLAGLVNNS